jgi:hypothetical protein
VSQPRFVSIDFGTSQTAVAVWNESGGARLVKLEGRKAPMPSAIFRTPEKEFLVGSQAWNSLRLDPAQGLRAPKRYLRNGTDAWAFGIGEPVAMTALIGEVMGYAYARAVSALGAAPQRVCLTCPVDWRAGGDRRKALRAAAVLGEVESGVEIVSEPEAAARHLGADLRPGQACVVYDLGGGTCDIAVMEMTKNGLEPREEAEEEIGGDDFDALLFDAVLERLGNRDKNAADRLKATLDPGPVLYSHDGEMAEWRRCSAELAENVQRAKELLSRQDKATIDVPPPFDEAFVFTRSDFEGLIGDLVNETMDALADCVDRSGIDPDAVFLAGASSQVPLVIESVERRLDQQSVLAKDPKGAIALGGLKVLLGPIEEARREEEAAAQRMRAGAERKKKARAKAADDMRELKDERFHANLDKLKGDPQWENLHVELQARITEAITGDEDVRLFGRCSPPGNFFMRANGAVVITSARMYWTRRDGLDAVHEEEATLSELSNPKTGWVDKAWFSVKRGDDLLRFNSLKDVDGTVIVEVLTKLTAE